MEIKKDEIKDYLDNYYLLIEHNIYEIIKIYRYILSIDKDIIKKLMIQNIKKLLKDKDTYNEYIIKVLLRELNNSPNNKYKFDEFEDINKYLEQ
jgi:hypothetical protein